jgi:excinuclease UvrABC helicase subunit UvrB
MMDFFKELNSYFSSFTEEFEKEVVEFEKNGVVSTMTVFFNKDGYIMGSETVTDVKETTEEKIEKLKVRIQNCVDQEEYSEAARLKEQIEQLKFML